MTAPALRPPTALAGYSDYSFWGHSLTDALEHVPQLLFPASIPVYAEMRRDPQLAAVLAGITLPIRRATWQVDPAGCRPDVARMVADDLGMPVAGDDTPGAARVRGVSWPEHLRSALLHLVYGFYSFELLADASTGQARLAGLYERVPSSIAWIHATDNGDFGGITQVMRPEGKDGEPEITPDRLVHYVHEREGAGWHGTSMLRPGYGSWYVKQDLRRVLATSHRRFATGVPTIEWAPGSIPTPQQMEQAQQAASAARVGETAGLALPPGAHLVLTGLSGGVPNTIEALRWIDQQISGMVLSRWMDLGSSQTGSRALGESFIDTFLLSIQALAEGIADTATRQVAARIVEWNWGDDEPVPRITVSDVGTRHEVTADALGALLSSGALSADPRLEEWVRRTYRLPERDPATPWQPPTPKGGPRTSGSVTDALALAASKRRRTPKPPTGQLELPVAAATVEPDTGDDLAAATADLQGAWPQIAEPMVTDLADQAGQAVESDNLGLLGSIAVSSVVVAGVAAALAAAMSGLAGAVAAALVTGRRKAPDMTGAARIGQVAQATAGILANVYASTAARAAMQQPGATAATVATAVRTALEGLSTAQAGLVADHLCAALHMSEGAALIAVCEQYPPKTLTASERRDVNECEPCSLVDGTTYQSLAAALEDYMDGATFRGCLGQSRCRGRLIPSWR